jgi:CheY-like chemotaxis protein
MLRNQTVLHVEDDDAITFLLQRILRKEGFTGHYQCVASVDEAISYVTRQGHFADAIHYPTPSVFLTDVGLGGGRTALDLIVWLRQRPEHARTPVVVITGGVDSATQEKMERAGANAFVMKGGTLKDLTEQLRVAFQKCGLE